MTTKKFSNKQQPKVQPTQLANKGGKKLKPNVSIYHIDKLTILFKHDTNTLSPVLDLWNLKKLCKDAKLLRLKKSAQCSWRA
jgi:hypothetical protein